MHVSRGYKKKLIILYIFTLYIKNNNNNFIDWNLSMFILDWDHSVQNFNESFALDAYIPSHGFVANICIWKKRTFGKERYLVNSS